MIPVAVPLQGGSPAGPGQAGPLRHAPARVTVMIGMPGTSSNREEAESIRLTWTVWSHWQSLSEHPSESP